MWVWILIAVVVASALAITVMVVVVYVNRRKKTQNGRYLYAFILCVLNNSYNYVDIVPYVCHIKANTVCMWNDIKKKHNCMCLSKYRLFQFHAVTT